MFEKDAKSHLPKLISRAGRSDISGPERVSVHSTAEMKLYRVSSTPQILSLHIFSSMRSDGQHLPIVPSKRCDSASQKQAYTASVLETPPNCRSFYDDLYQTQLSGCSAFPESRLQSLPHP